MPTVWAGGHFDIDTTAYDNGVHAIFWTATDSAGTATASAAVFFHPEHRSSRPCGPCGLFGFGAPPRPPTLHPHCPKI